MTSKFIFTKRRSISTIVGGFIFLIIVAGSFAALILMMQANTDFLRTQIDVSTQEIRKIQEDFTIGASYDNTDAKRLCVSIKNTGGSPLEITDLWISNKSSAASYDTKLVEIGLSDSFIPIGSTGQILENQRVTLKNVTRTYDIKAVSSLGTTKTTELRVFANSGVDPRLNVTVFAYPVNVASGQNVTIGMHVYNMANTTLIEVQPNGDPTVQPAEAVQSYPLRTSPRIIPRLDPNEDALFQWDPEITGGVGSKLNFSASAKAKVEGCSTSSFITSKTNTTQIKIVPGTRRQILASPETFGSFPNPFGDASGTTKGKFALVVINPTDNSFKISQVSIQLINSRAEDLITSIAQITPTGGWTEGHSILVWKGTGTSQITIPPNGMKVFIVDAQPIVTTSTPINSIVYNVYSTYGQFSNGPFTLGVSSSATAIVSLYHNTTFAAGGVANYTVTTTSGVENKRFNLTITNTGDSSISSGSYMLINVPPGMRNIANVTASAFSDLTTEQPGKNVGLRIHQFLEFDDGSTQIPIELTSDLPSATTKSYSFRATMPSISVPAFYTITLTANGTTTDATPVIIGPASQVVVQVCPTGGC